MMILDALKHNFPTVCPTASVKKMNWKKGNSRLQTTYPFFVPASFTIQLHNLRLFGSHGLYAEEAQAGNAFEVNVSMEVKAPKETVHLLEETINYAEVYRTIRHIFSVRRKLLETLAMEMADELKQQFPAAKKIKIQISKINPPIATFSGTVSVTYKKRFRIKKDDPA